MSRREIRRLNTTFVITEKFSESFTCKIGVFNRFSRLFFYFSRLILIFSRPLPGTGLFNPGLLYVVKASTDNFGNCKTGIHHI